MRFVVRFLAISLAVLGGAASFAQDDPEKAELKRQIQELKEQQKRSQQDFDSRLKKLEAKLNENKPAETPSTKFEGLVQTRYDADSGANDSFFLRRVELKFSGRVHPKVGWTVMMDLAKQLKLSDTSTIDQASRALQDAYLTVDLNKRFSLDLGQKKVPFSYEGLLSAGNLDTLERALLVSQGKFGDVRDIGVQLKGKWPEVEATAAVMNGAGESQNQADQNEQKTFGGRVVFSPRQVNGLHLGVDAISGTSPATLKKERLGLEGQFQSGLLTLRGELASGLTDGKRQRGWYGHVGYRFAPLWEGIARLDAWDPNLRLPGDGERDALIGFNYFLAGNGAKLQFNYLHRRLGDRSIRNQYQLGLQTKW